MTEAARTAGAETSPRLQPLLHDLSSCVAAPGLLLSSPDGQLRPGGVSGWFVGDVRLLDRLELSVAGSDLDLVRTACVDADRQEFSYVARNLGDRIPDPTVRIDRVRRLAADGFTESLVVESVAQEPVDLLLRLDVGTDLASMAAVKQGRAGVRIPAQVSGGGFRWADARADVVLTSDPAPEAEAGTGRLTWRWRLGRGERREVVLRVTSGFRPMFGAGRPGPWGAAVEAVDLRVRRTFQQSLADLEGLLLRDGADRFLAAGSPWFLTLFGRDSLWAARMLVPFDTSLALSTLRVLARRQGTGHDETTEEQPGKILHEVRPGELDLGAQVLPPVYYGSVDATPLFVCTLADAHAWGADIEQVRELLPAARACLTWLMEHSAESGWLRYVDHTGHGLSNQGWKDSHDSVQFADGRLADPPIALSEVQAYAYEAAVRGSALLDACGAEPVPGLVAWAESVRARFTDEFWVETADGGHVAIALDGEGRPADSVTSNLGHLLGTGLLPAPATARLCALLTDPRLDSGFGLRTLASDSPRFSRLSYHGGTVWPHDTAIAVRGLAAEGRLDEAASLGSGLIAAAEALGYRLPELYGGDSSADVTCPSVYPAACRPQAWSAAAPLAVLVAVTGIVADATTGRIEHPARTGRALGAFTLRGLRMGKEPFDVHVDHDGSVRVELTPGSDLTVHLRESGPGAEE